MVSELVECKPTMVDAYDKLVDRLRGACMHSGQWTRIGLSGCMLEHVDQGWRTWRNGQWSCVDGCRGTIADTLPGVDSVVLYYQLCE